MTAMTFADSGQGAPVAPGALGVPVDAAAAQTYLRQLREWVANKRQDLDAVDRAVITLPQSEQAGLTADLTVALTFWKAISDRLVLLETTWDGGRVGPTEAARLSTLIHGRLDTTGTDTLSLPSTGSLAMSLPEACRLLESLTRTLQARASLAPGVAEASRRITDLRASLERVRDQLPVTPAGPVRDQAAQAVLGLEARITDLLDRARRGADVGGLVGPLDIEISSLERDLIVAAAEQHRAQASRAQTVQRVEELSARAEALRQLEQQCIASVDPAPHLAIPDPHALGEPPTTASDLAVFDGKLDRVSQALDLAHTRYAEALGERDEIVGLTGALAALVATAHVSGEASADLTELRRRLDEATTSKPMPLARSRALAAAFEAYVDSITHRRKAAR